MSTNPTMQRLRITFGKFAALKYTSNLDVAKIWERVLRRALKEMVLQGSDLRLRIEHLEAAKRRENARRHRARTR